MNVENTNADIYLKILDTGTGQSPGFWEECSDLEGIQGPVGEGVGGGIHLPHLVDSF